MATQEADRAGERADTRLRTLREIEEGKCGGRLPYVVDAAKEVNQAMKAIDRARTHLCVTETERDAALRKCWNDLNAVVSDLIG